MKNKQSNIGWIEDGLIKDLDFPLPHPNVLYFRLFKESKICIHPGTNFVTNSAYLVLQKLHDKTQILKEK